MGRFENLAISTLWRTGGIYADVRGFNELSESEFSTLTDKCHHDSFSRHQVQLSNACQKALLYQL